MGQRDVSDVYLLQLRRVSSFADLKRVSFEAQDPHPLRFFALLLVLADSGI